MKCSLDLLVCLLFGIEAATLARTLLQCDLSFSFSSDKQLLKNSYVGKIKGMLEYNCNIATTPVPSFPGDRKKQNKTIGEECLVPTVLQFFFSSAGERGYSPCNYQYTRRPQVQLHFSDTSLQFVDYGYLPVIHAISLIPRPSTPLVLNLILQAIKNWRCRRSGNNYFYAL